MRQVTTLARVLGHLRSNVVAYAALFVALGGVGWAAADPLLDRRGSVDSANIENREIVKRDLAPRLRRDLGLVFKPPANGPYFNGFKGGNSGITIEIEDGDVVRVVIESAPSAPPACAFTQQPSAHIVNTPVGKGLVAVEIANSASNVFQAEVHYSTRSAVVLSEATARSDAGICLLPPDLEVTRVSASGRDRRRLHYHAAGAGAHPRLTAAERLVPRQRFARDGAWQGWY